MLCRFLNSFFDGLEYEPIEAFCKVTRQLSSMSECPAFLGPADVRKDCVCLELGKHKT